MKLHWHWSAINPNMWSGRAAQYVAHLTFQGNCWHWTVFDTYDHSPAFIGAAVSRNAALAAAELVAYNDANGIDQCSLSTELLPGPAKFAEGRTTKFHRIKKRLLSLSGGRTA